MGGRGAPPNPRSDKLGGLPSATARSADSSPLRMKLGKAHSLFLIRCSPGRWESATKAPPPGEHPRLLLLLLLLLLLKKKVLYFLLIFFDLSKLILLFHVTRDFLEKVNHNIFFFYFLFFINKQFYYILNSCVS